MIDALKEYQDAYSEFIIAARSEVTAMDTKKKAHARLLRAKEELRAQEREAVNQIELIPLRVNG